MQQAILCAGEGRGCDWYTVACSGASCFRVTCNDPAVPQVIEMTQVTAASDIWSVGCLILELLTGYPPYYDLQPMSALFRIVQASGRRAGGGGSI